MNKRVLFIDDDERILAGFRRNLHGVFEVDTAVGPEAGLAKVKDGPAYAVVVSDLRMPGMDGIAVLAKVRELRPDTVRVMLTGFADLEAAIAAVNEGNIFRFLTKPCEVNYLKGALGSAVEQYRLVVAERELLEGTLRGSLRMLSEVLSLLRPEVYGRVSRIAPYVRPLAKLCGDPSPWQTEAAAMLCLMGFITLPDTLVSRVERGRSLSAEDTAVYQQHAEVAARLVANIPRMGGVAKAIAYQEKNFDGSGFPADAVRGKDIPLGARILRVLLEFDRLVGAGQAKADAYKQLRQGAGLYDPDVVAALGEVLGEEGKYVIMQMAVKSLREGMILAEDMFVTRGGQQLKVLPRGYALSSVALAHIAKLARYDAVTDPVKVIIPADL
ncbi:HD domain-containing phosphohydrolase [Solidesulfovibrio sp.]|uniref:HD domain-containing phosphohydrolase n=1 Tax=Solidesulfovibrio sp. TaxID=2910990 RepID=UPI002B210AB2|nr:HD domain-containing phosphohydrolase [Solidesulfovibrio sp.]MEA4858717.1 HD domain-containing phosphohydrolase [Solidesulfovibrio sp.]